MVDVLTRAWSRRGGAEPAWWVRALEAQRAQLAGELVRLAPWVELAIGDPALRDRL